MRVTHIVRSVVCRDGQRRYTLTGPAPRVDRELRLLQNRYRCPRYVVRIVKVDVGAGIRVARLWCLDQRELEPTEAAGA